MISLQSIAKTGFAAAAAATLLAMTAGAAQAACELSIEPASTQWIVPYDPFTDDAAVRQFDVAMVNLGDSDCRGSIHIDLNGELFGLAQAGRSGRVLYSLVDEGSGTDVTPRAGQNPRGLNARPVRLSPGERGLFRFSLVAAPGELLSRGTYTQTAILSVRDPRDMPLDEQPLVLGIEVASAAVMGLSGEFRRSARGAVIDLGELTPGPKPLAASLYVHSTGGYIVSISSANRGRLRLGSTEWYLNYSLGVGDRAANLASSDSFSVVSNDAREDNYPLSVSIGEVSGKRAGAYSDVVTFTVAAM